MCTICAQSAFDALSRSPNAAWSARKVLAFILHAGSGETFGDHGAAGVPAAFLRARRPRSRELEGRFCPRDEYRARMRMPARWPLRLIARAGSTAPQAMFRTALENLIPSAPLLPGSEPGPKSTSIGTIIHRIAALQSSLPPG